MGGEGRYAPRIEMDVECAHVDIGGVKYAGYVEVANAG